MSRYTHIAIAASYVLIALAIGIIAPLHLNSVNAALAVAYAGMVLIAGALLHEAWTRFQREGHIGGELRTLRHDHARVSSELSIARSGLIEIHHALKQSAGEAGDLKRVAAEVEVLQKLVTQLWDREQIRIENTDAAGSTEIATPPGAMDMDDALVLDLVREALTEGRVDLYLQPIVQLPQRKHKFYECYSRVRAADGSVILPERYIDVAERAGIVTAIDNMLLFRAVQLIRRARRKNASVGFVCNISRESLADRSFLHDFADFIEQNADLAPSVVFELAQAAYDPEDYELKAYMDDLASIGIRFSLDRVTDLDLDCELLAARHFRFVKLDCRMFDVEGDGLANDAPLLRLKRELAYHDIAVIIEKIESEKELVELLEYDIDFGQGYLFGEPKLSPEI